MNFVFAEKQICTGKVISCAKIVITNGPDEIEMHFTGAFPQVTG